MYGFLNKDLDPSHVSEWTWDPVLTDYWFNSGSVTLASTLPPCASSTGAAVASTVGSSTDSSTTTTGSAISGQTTGSASSDQTTSSASSDQTTGSTSSRQTQTASRSMNSLTPHPCCFHLFPSLFRSAWHFDHRPRAFCNIKTTSPVLIPNTQSNLASDSPDNLNLHAMLDELFLLPHTTYP